MSYTPISRPYKVMVAEPDGSVTYYSDGKVSPAFSDPHLIISRALFDAIPESRGDTSLLTISKKNVENARYYYTFCVKTKQWLPTTPVA